MGNLGQAYADLGMELFDEGEYEQSVQYLIKAYKLGYEREAIIEHLYACFIQPNEEEFRKTYSESEGVSNLSFEELTLDFIPVSEEKYYIFDRETKEFQGFFEPDPEPVVGEKKVFDSILFGDVWDIREMLEELKTYQYTAVYLVLNEMESKFASFLKLPGIQKRYLDKAVVFADMHSMKEYFEANPDRYLPKKVVAENAQVYGNLLLKLHEQRLHQIKQPRNNIFLSICIPSFNRGSLALKTVKHLLQCVYDSEIEIIVSNNGSTEDVKGYQEIQKLQDSRIRYHEFDSNQGFASNLLKVLELAKGTYAVLVSDEDTLVLEALGEYFSRLEEYHSAGVFWEKGIGENFSQKEFSIQKAGVDAMEGAMFLSYITGVTFKMELLHRQKAFDILHRMRGNTFVEVYPHIALAMIAAKYSDYCYLDMILCVAGKNGEEEKSVETVLEQYMLPENRVEQWESELKFIRECIQAEKKLYRELFLEGWNRQYSRVWGAYELKYEAYQKLGEWEEICLYLYRSCQKGIDDFPYTLTEEDSTYLKNAGKLLFQDYLYNVPPASKKSLKKVNQNKILRRLLLLELENEGSDTMKIKLGENWKLSIGIEKY